MSTFFSNSLRALAVFTVVFSLSCTRHAVIAPRPWLSPALLTSERVEKKLGNVHVVLLFQDEKIGLRLSSLQSDIDGKTKAMTMALVKFNPIIDPRLTAVHKQIVEGASLGASLKDHGFGVEKHLQSIGMVRPPARVKNLLSPTVDSFAAVSYHLNAVVGDNSIPYCSITEIYAPEFLSLDELKTIHGYKGPAQNSELIEQDMVLIDAVMPSSNG